MQQKSFGKLPPASVLTLGGGGLGMVWGDLQGTPIIGKCGRLLAQLLLRGGTGGEGIRILRLQADGLIEVLQRRAQLTLAEVG